ncbi:MAG: right-handed parallel beta-helix repeat-containing protein [Rhodanobacteraceae bacterium]|nr:right-handed parallel beta-helix repeat-containing protein [Rhodanobacteraceae bacterium]
MRWIVCLALPPLAALALPLAAANFCVSNSAALQEAIETAASNSDTNDQIRMRPGIYPSPPNGFGRAVFAPDDNIAISGGWLPLIGPCDLPGYDPSASVIDGEGQRAGLVIHRSGSGSGETNLSWLTIRGGRQMMSSLFYGNGGGLAIFGSGPVRLENLVFRSNRANVNGGAVYLGGGERTLRNNLFVDNQAVTGSAVYAPAGGAVVLSNNTVTANISAGAGTYAVDLSNVSPVSAWNNILSGNLGGGMDLGAFFALLTQNNLGSFCCMADGGSQGNSTADPQFVSASDQRLRRTSPAIDAGVNNSVGSRDLDGRPRQIGPAVDQGSYEVDFMFADGFD